jgi:hypothetical protein
MSSSAMVMAEQQVLVGDNTAISSSTLAVTPGLDLFTWMSFLLHGTWHTSVAPMSLVRRYCRRVIRNGEGETTWRHDQAN